MTGTPEKRKKLSPKRRAEMAIEQKGRCGCADVRGVHPIYADFPVCGGKLSSSEGIIDEHLWPLEAGGSNDPDNRRLLRSSCARIKTDKFDRPLIAKVKGQAGERGSQIHRRASGKGRKLQGPGFDSRFTRPIATKKNPRPKAVRREGS